MALIQTLKLSFNPGGSADRVMSRLRVVNEGDPIDYNVTSTDITGSTVDIPLVDLMPDADGIYDLYLTDVDDAGNESDFHIIQGVTVDFLAPSAPDGGVVS